MVRGHSNNVWHSKGVAKSVTQAIFAFLEPDGGKKARLILRVTLYKV